MKSSLLSTTPSFCASKQLSLAITAKAALASAGVIAAGFVALGVELALGDGDGAGGLQAARLATSIPVIAKVDAILMIFILSPIFACYC